MSDAIVQEIRPLEWVERSEPPTCFDHPTVGFGIINTCQMGFDLLWCDRQSQVIPEAADRRHGPCWILESLAKQSLGLLGIAADPLVELGGIAGHHGLVSVKTVFVGDPTCIQAA